MLHLDQYLALARKHARFLAFGTLLAFTSSAGQTYFIGVFGPEIRQSFGLSHSQWGTIYLVGTLSSALLLPFTGQLVDRVDLRLYVSAVVAGLTLACVSLSLAASITTLTIAIFLLRHFGQGLTSHSAITSMARYMDQDRGKSIAIASTGFSLGEACLPVLAVVVIGTLGWRHTYVGTALAVAGLLCVILWLLRGHRERHAAHVNLYFGIQGTGITQPSSSTRRQMLSQPRFYLLLPAIVAPSYVATGLFFHHLTLASDKGWSGLWVTGNYWIYALLSVLSSLIAGPLIDKFSAARVIPYYLLPMMLALSILAFAHSSIWIVPYMALLGINTGVYFTAVSALWAELYGTKYLGGIKSLVSAFGVFASALGPVSIGVLLDNGYSFEHVCIMFALFCGIATFLLITGLKRFR